ncbi:Alpha/Beta hydrolase protein [Mycena epipterygia]|nr:Alpha/Beta hydrolase protein [Mycena epipterygia]
MPLNRRSDEPATVSGDITEISEDRLRLNIIRPIENKTGDKLPVLAVSFKDDPVSQPGGRILQSIANGHPIIHASINYRLGNPSSITIHGQSSGALAVSSEYADPRIRRVSAPPFQRAIAESQALEPGITGNFTRGAMARVLNATGCTVHAQDSCAAAACLRNLTMNALLAADLLVVDGDFVTDASSALIAAGRVGDVSFIGGWTENDAGPFLQLLEPRHLYPVSDFPPSYDSNGTLVLTAEFNRAGRILRGIAFSRSWSGVVATGDPSVGRSTLRGLREAVFDDENYGTYVIGGPNAGYGAVDGSARTELAKQKISQRCGFLNPLDVVLNY